MRYIDKSLNQAAANALVNAFLASRWDVHNNCYTSISYSGQEFINNLKPNLKQLLLTEQQFLCCYCMRRLTNITTTFEHIVPRSTVTQLGLNQYTHNHLIDVNVCLQSVFDSATVPVVSPPYPLEIGYENLTASCKGDFPGSVTYHICNHKRGSAFIEPLFYIPTIANEVSYLKGGLLSSSNSGYDNSIIVLNLNYDSLERIRQVWYYISVENIVDIENAATEAQKNDILTVNLMSLPPERRNRLIADFKNETFWNVLLLYKWFHSYYIMKYPIADR